MPVRFLTREQVAEELNISMAQAYALIRRGELRAAKIGGRGDYRIGREGRGTSDAGGIEAFIGHLPAFGLVWVGIEHRQFLGEPHQAARERRLVACPGFPSGGPTTSAA